MSAADVLRAAVALADALRRLHDRGGVDGALEPCRVVLSESGASLAPGGAESGVAAYSAPEQVLGQPADARSDIFAFGAIVYEMLAGQSAFAGEGEDLRTAILEREPAPLSGDAGGLARLALRCMAKAPGQRWQRIQNVQLELKLLNVLSRRGEQNPEARDNRLQSVLRQEIARVEEAVNARLSSIEVANFELKRNLAEERERLNAANQATQELRGEIAALSGRIEEGAQERKAASTTAEEAKAAMSSRLDGIDRMLAAHGSSIESLGTAVTQSDDLIERLVDTFDALERSLAGEGKAQAAAAL